MLQGIPYTKDYDIQEIMWKIQKENKEYQTKQTTLYDLATKGIEQNILVVIDNQWVSWLKDLQFNYRDRICTLPYYTYDLFEIDPLSSKNKYNHLYMSEDNGLFVRFNYDLAYINIDINTKLLTYNIDSDIFTEYEITDYISDKFMDINELYKRYIISSYKPTIVDEKDSGYHYIDKTVKGLRNEEKTLRRKRGLPTYSLKYREPKDYRDVREYRYEEIVVKYGFQDSNQTYKVRRLLFESYLYCHLREHHYPKEFKPLKTGSDYIKIGDTVKLIIKGYWLDGKDKPKDYTWR